MQVHLTQEQKDKFTKIIFHESVIHPGEMTSFHFYEKFMDFIDENEIEMEEKDLDNAEKEMYSYCIDKGYIFTEQVGIIVGEQKEKFIKKIKQSAPRVFFHIIQYDKELAELSVSELYEKVGDKVSGGWIASYCTCGSFFPLSKDFNDNEDNEYPEPVEISLEDVDYIVIRTDNVLHFYMADSDIIYECAALGQIRTCNMLQLYIEE